MKNHTIKTPTAELMIVELPENKDIDFYEHGRELLLLTKGYIQLGKPDEISEEDAGPLLDAHPDIYDENKYKNYMINDNEIYIQYPFKTTTESLLSLLESEIFWKNPLGTKRNVEKIASFKSEIARKHLIALWHKAEQKTFDRNRSIIFKKPTPKI